MFVLYILALIYFLFLPGALYGNPEVLELQRAAGIPGSGGQSSGKCCRIYAFWYDPSADLQKCKRIFLHHFLWIYTEPVCGSDPAYDKTGKL